MKLGKPQLILIAGGVVLIVLLIMLPRFTAPEKPAETTEHKHDEIDLEAKFNSYTDSVNKALQKNAGFAALLEKFNKEKNQVSGDTLVNWLTVNNQPVMSALYSYETAKAVNTERALEIAGTRLFNASQFAPEGLSKALIGNAIVALDACLKMNPNNLKAKTILGSCYVSGSQDPMKGITLLREVVAQDSNYIEAHLKLAMFAVQSGQNDKAIARFNKILDIDPNFIEAYLYIGEVYASINEKDKAIKNLELFKAKSNDAVVINEVDKYINELKNK